MSYGIILGWIWCCPAVLAAGTPREPVFKGCLLTHGPGKIVLADLDGDGLRDILWLEGHTLSIYFQDAGGSFCNAARAVRLEPVPMVIWPAKLGTSAESLLLWTHDGVSVMNVPRGAAPPEVKRLIACSTIIPAQTEGPADVHVLQLSMDTSGPFPLILLPTETGLEVWAWQERWRMAQRLPDALAHHMAGPGDGIGYDLQTSLNLCMGDLNSDGLADLVVCTPHNGVTRFVVYTQNRDGSVPWEQRTSLSGDWDWHTTWACWVDINKDGRPDFITSRWLREPSSAPGSRSGKVLVRIFLADAAGQLPGEPQCVLRKNDWTPQIPVVDVDGDGFVDMILGYSLLGTTEAARRMFSAGQIEHTLEFHMFRPAEGYRKEPDCREDLLVYFGELSAVLDTGVVHSAENLVSLAGDFNGDGARDLLVQDHSQYLSAYFFRSRETGFSKKADLHFRHDDACTGFLVDDLNGDGISDLIILLRSGAKVFLSGSR